MITRASVFVLCAAALFVALALAACDAEDSAQEASVPAMKKSAAQESEAKKVLPLDISASNLSITISENDKKGAALTTAESDELLALIAAARVLSAGEGSQLKWEPTYLTLGESESGHAWRLQTPSHESARGEHRLDNLLSGSHAYIVSLALLEWLESRK